MLSLWSVLMRIFIVSLKETAEYLEVAEITVRRWVKDGILKSKRIGKSIVLDVDELKAFKKSRR